MTHPCDKGLIQRLHAAASDAARMPDAMGQLAEALSADGVQVLVYTHGGDGIEYCVCGGIDPAANDDYRLHYHAYDFRIRRALKAAPWRVYDDDDFINPQEKRASPVHQEFLKRYDCETVILATAPLDSARTLLLVAGRSARSGAFDEEARQRMLGYLPYVQHSVAMTLKLSSVIHGAGSIQGQGRRFKSHTSSTALGCRA